MYINRRLQSRKKFVTTLMLNYHSCNDVLIHTYMYIVFNYYMFSTCFIFRFSRLAELIGQLEERERNSEMTVLTLDKELTLKQEAIEKHKHKAMESVQSAQEWGTKVTDLQTRLDNAESALKSKVEECEKESRAAKRSTPLSPSPPPLTFLPTFTGVKKKLVE